MTTPTRRHRAPDRIRELEQQVAKLTEAGNRMVEPILQGIQDATALEEARAKIERLERHAARVAVRHDREVRDLREENSRLRAEHVDAGSLAQQLAAAEDHIRTLSAERLALAAQVANANAITVPPMHRDVDPGEQPTTPVDVRAVRRSYTVKPLADALGGAV